MSNKQQQAYPADDVEQTVVEYLHTHPDFFNHHLKLLGALRIPHPCRPAVSLIERQLELLRRQNAQLHQKLRELVDAARDNDRLYAHMQRLALMLIEATELDDVLQGIKAVLRDDFDADFTALRLAAQPLKTGLKEEQEFLFADILHLFEAVLRSGRPRCGRLSDAQVHSLFGESAPSIASVALVPLQGNDWQGLLAVGSQDEERFHPGMGTLFLRHIGELISQALQPHLGPLDPRSNPSLPPLPEGQAQ